MNRNPFGLASLVFLLLVAPLLTAGDATASDPVSLVIAFQGPIPLDVEAQLEQRGATLQRRDDILQFVVARTSMPERLHQWANTTDVNIKFVETPRTIQSLPAPTEAATSSLASTADFPNDPLYWKQENGLYVQWALRKVHAAEAWTMHAGSENIVVAVVDTGVDHAHPDLQQNIARRLDGSILGIDLAEQDADPMDYHGHGTFLSGIIAARTHNQIGMSGMAQVHIMPVRVTDGTGMNQFDSHLAASGIAWAATNGARVITASFHVNGDDSTLRLGIDYATRLGSLVVAAAGNLEGASPKPPATYPDVLTVTAHAHDDTVPSYVARGNSIDIAAPGGAGFPPNVDDLVSLGPSGAYRVMYGTSFAVGYVAGTAGLILSANPVLSRGQVGDIIVTTSTDAGIPGHDSSYGHGLLHAERALQKATALADTTAPPPPGDIQGS